MKVGDKVKLLENSYTECEMDGLDMSPGQTGVIHELAWGGLHVHVIMDSDPERFPYCMYDTEVEVI